MLGHTLRLDTNSPAQKALQFALVGSNKYQAQRGRHWANLLEQIRSDVKLAGLGPLRTGKHLNNLRHVAEDRPK